MPVDRALQVVAAADIIHDSTQPALIHGLPLPAGCVKVTIIDPTVPDVPLPYPVDEATTVGSAVGRIIAWPFTWMLRQTPMVCILQQFV